MYYYVIIYVFPYLSTNWTKALLYVTAPLSKFIDTSGEAAGSADDTIKRAEKAIEIARKYDKHELKLEELKNNLSGYLVIFFLNDYFVYLWYVD